MSHYSRIGMHGRLNTAASFGRWRQPRKVFFDPLRHAAAHQVAERLDHGIGYRVDVAGALFPPGDETAIEEQLQMLGDVGLARFQFINQLGYRLLSTRQRLQDAKTKRLPQSTEAAGNKFKGAIRKYDFTHIYHCTTTCSCMPISFWWKQYNPHFKEN